MLSGGGDSGDEGEPGISPSLQLLQNLFLPWFWLGITHRILAKADTTPDISLSICLFQGQVEKKRTMTVAVFNQLYQFLERKKTFLLSQLEEMEEEILTRKEEHMARLVEKLSSLDGFIQEIEESYQPASVLLQVKGVE